MENMPEVQEENARLKRELKELQQRRTAEQQDYQARLDKERTLGKSANDTIQQKSGELEQMRSRMVRLARQLDDEVARRDQVLAESQALERQIQEADGGSMLSSQKGRGASLEQKERKEDEQRATQVSTKLMRVVDQWMRTKDIQQALLRGAAINDMSFSTVVQVLADCPSLQTLDLSQNQLTMDSCSDLCQLITTAPSLSFISLAENLFSLRATGYFMTSIMERQNTKKLTPLDLLDLHNNEGLVAAAAAPPPDAVLRRVSASLTGIRLPPRGAELLAQVTRALWRFLKDTDHPQVRSCGMDDVAFHIMDKMTLRKMESALMKVLLLAADEYGDGHANSEQSGMPAMRSVTGDLVFLALAAGDGDMDASGQSPDLGAQEASFGDSGGVRLPPIEGRGGLAASQSQAEIRGQARSMDGGVRAASTRELHDPFSDLKSAFEPRKEKAKTFNLKQIVTRNGTVLMNMLERLLETTEIDAHDVETDQTLLEYACRTGNPGLAKLCYRRGCNLSARTKSGETAFNIVTANKRYDLMEFLHTYGVKVNSADAKGKTALHVAAANNDVDGTCRLLEWGADVNIRDNKMQTPLHASASGGQRDVTMLLLEVGADMNAKDEKEYTAVAHAERNNHFTLMDRLMDLGGRTHSFSTKATGDMGGGRSKSMKSLGDLNVSAQMIKSTSLARIGKVRVSDLPQGPSGKLQMIKK